MLGGFFALLSAFTFALNNATVRRGVLSGTVWQAMAITVPLGVPIFFIVAWPTGSLGYIAGMSSETLAYLSAAGIVHFVWGRYCNYRATKAMGANLVAPVQQWSIVFTLGAAVFLLGEIVTPLRVIGVALVLLGPMLAASGEGSILDLFRSKVQDKPKRERASGWEPRLLEGYTFALLSSTGYGASPILVSLGLQHKSLGESLAGGLLSYAAATCATLLFFLWPGRLRHALEMSPLAARWFTISGIFVCLSQMFRYLALSVAPVSVVTPISRLALIFRFYLAKLFNPEHEVFGAEMVWATAISMLGVLALSVSTETVLTYVPLPDWLAAVARWQWP